MQRTPVSSSNIRSVGYDQSQSLMEVEFSTGDVYQYFNVSQQIYNNFVSSASPGQFMDQYIRGKYDFQKV